MKIVKCEITLELGQHFVSTKRSLEQRLQSLSDILRGFHVVSWGGSVFVSCASNANHRILRHCIDILPSNTYSCLPTHLVLQLKDFMVHSQLLTSRWHCFLLWLQPLGNCDLHRCNSKTNCTTQLTDERDKIEPLVVVRVFIVLIMLLVLTKFATRMIPSIIGAEFSFYSKDETAWSFRYMSTAYASIVLLALGKGDPLQHSFRCHSSSSVCLPRRFSWGPMLPQE